MGSVLISFFTSLIALKASNISQMILYELWFDSTDFSMLHRKVSDKRCRPSIQGQNQELRLEYQKNLQD